MKGNKWGCTIISPHWRWSIKDCDCKSADKKPPRAQRHVNPESCTPYKCHRNISQPIFVFHYIFLSSLPSLTRIGWQLLEHWKERSVEDKFHVLLDSKDKGKGYCFKAPLVPFFFIFFLVQKDQHQNMMFTKSRFGVFHANSLLISNVFFGGGVLSSLPLAHKHIGPWKVSTE